MKKITGPKNIYDIFLILCVILSVLKLFLYANEHPGIDFYQFWAVGQELGNCEAENIYSEESNKSIAEKYLNISYKKKSHPNLQKAALIRRKGLETYSTPFLYLFFHFLFGSDYNISYHSFQIFSTFTYIFALIVFCRLLKYSFRGTLFIFIALSFWFYPILGDIRVGNVNRLQLGMLALYLLFLKRKNNFSMFISGTFAGAIILFKPNIVFAFALISLFWLFSQKIQLFIFHFSGFILSTTAGILFSSLYLKSWKVWYEWIKAIQAIPKDIIKLNMGNLSLPTIIFEITGVDISSSNFILFIFLMCIVVLIFSRKDSVKSEAFYYKNIFLVISTGILFSTLSSWLLWTHYFALTVPLIIYLFKLFSQKRSMQLFYYLTAGASVILISVYPFVRLTGITNKLFVGIMMCAGTSVLLLLGVKEMLCTKDEVLNNE